MQFIKKNWEKLLLAVIVLAALGIAVFLPFVVSKQKQEVDDALNSYIKAKRKPMPPIDLSVQETFLKRAQSDAPLDLVTPHKIFNPVRWQMATDGHVFPNPAGHEIDQLQVTGLSPLNFVISYVSASPTPGLATHYGIGLTHEAAVLTKDRTRKTTYVPLNETTNGFTIIALDGPADDPTGLKLQLDGVDEPVTITKDQPYKRVEGHTIDMKYPPENHTFPVNRRVGDTICFAGECYKIVDIKESEVVLLQQSNQKTWIKKFSLTNSTATATPP